MIDNKFEIIKYAERHLDDAKHIVETHSELFELCKKYIEMWNSHAHSDRTALLSISDNYIGVNMNLYLSKEDSMKDIDLFIEDIENKLKLKYISTDEYTEGRWIRYYFQDKDNANLYIFFNYERSEHCKLVDTGEYKPIFKRVCI